MPEDASEPAEADPVALAALNDLMEAYFEYIGHKEARALLRSIAARVAAGDSVIPMKPETAMRGRTWIQSQLPRWLARHG